MTLFRNMALRWKLILAFRIIVLFSGTVAFLALTMGSEVRIDIAQLQQAAMVDREVQTIDSLVQRAKAILLSFALLIPVITSLDRRKELCA